MILQTDEYAIKATLPGDPIFFFRRLRDPSCRFTDLMPGALSDAQMPKAIHHFMVLSGGWPLDYLEYHSLGDATVSEAQKSAREARISGWIGRALPLGSVTRTERVAHRHVTLLRMHFGP
ncbi:hypothetical protein KDD17_01810 [Sulfitobacter albidus]|uniref:Uncharacterized protein n=1 Tax=Sulfitobacter albidus TaxID=2829501 RepID=A0A975JE73_9RHOB|nr:hypothetical protein [Sulfitobacter albidus]QUJ76823.1 hypothetical protein KDD17_01810 [Sulfitobacter albidus]